jgi:two-component system, OmpR family, response regulator
MRILLVEDDDVLRGVMLRSLSDAGHRVDVATALDDARHLWLVQPFDAVLLDLNLPSTSRPTSAAQHSQASGLTALREARARGDRTPVLVLTARDRTDERIAGLDAGADDYLGKPFDLNEVEARLRALVRRSQGAADVTELGQLTLDRKARRLFLAGQDLELPAREFEVLWELMTPPGRVVNKTELANKLADLDGHLGDNALEVFISRLRKKLSGSGAGIRTLRGLGYLIEAERDAAA